MHVTRYIQAVCLMAILSLPAFAQEGGLPQLDIEEVTVVGKRVITLPKARKGEVLDTSGYRLPQNDTLIFGDRVSNLGGPGGTLPGYRELTSPLRLNYEASIGSYISPHGLFQAEYLQKRFGLTGVIDYRGTMGHVDSAEASSLLVSGHGSVLIGGDGEGPPRSLVSADIEYIGDSYTLYGDSLAPFDRSRAATRFNAGFKSQEDGLVNYLLNVEIARTGIGDQLRDSSADVSALSAGVGFMLSAGTDSLRGNLRVDYAATSLHYETPTNSPSYVSIQLNGEWVPAPRFFVTGGLLYANAQHSDSGSSTLFMPRASLRYELNETVSIFGWFIPELRAPSYRNRIMEAPYVDREIVLKPESVPVRLAGGVRLTTEPMVIEARATFESAVNTPVVTAASTAGHLRYDHVDTRTVGAEGSIQLHVIPNIDIEGDAVIRSATVVDLDQQVPMTPQIDLRGRINYAVTPAIELFGTLDFKTAQQTTLADSLFNDDLRQIPARFLLGGGGSYKVSDVFELFVGISNLLNYSYDWWQNYSAPGFEIRGGVRGRL
jgi:outer membrane receptor protein involved in Fe transport